MIQPPFPSTIRAQTCQVAFLTTKTAVRKNQENDGQTRLPCLDKPVLAQGHGGGGGHCVHACSARLLCPLGCDLYW